MLNVIMPSVVVPSVVAPKVNYLNVIDARLFSRNDDLCRRLSSFKACLWLSRGSSTLDRSVENQRITLGLTSHVKTTANKMKPGACIIKHLWL
jgi:hypothetical protein